MTAIAAPPAATITGPEPLRPRPGRKILRTAGSVALVAAIFGFALPHFASYRSVWDSMRAMTWTQVLLIAAAAARQYGLYLDHDLLGTAIDTAARSGRGQPRFQRSGEHPARRRGPRHGGQLGDALELGCQHG